MAAETALRAPGTRAFWLALALACGGTLAAPRASAQAEPDVAQTTVYVRTDTDRTTIVTPSLHVGAQVAEDTRVDLTYSVDVWTSASVDIRTSASKRVTDTVDVTPGAPPSNEEPHSESNWVTEQRDEIDVALDQRVGDIALGGSYRYSLENDYESHGGSLGASFDFAQKASTLSVVARALFDQVWAAGGEDLKRPTSTLSARIAFTQVIDREMLGQLTYELGRQSGYLASPYRYVRVADDRGVVPSTCVAPVDTCLPENDPDSRLRHAVALQLRRALSATLSVGFGYRFYLDDWKLGSHTVELDVAWAPDEAWLLGAAYRFYTQTKAEHYEPYYEMASLPEFYTADKELSGLLSHRLGVELSRLWEIDDAGSRLRTVLRAGPTIYFYRDFPLLDYVTAYEVTLSAGLEL